MNLAESRWRVYEGSLYCSHNISVNLKFCFNKMLENSRKRTLLSLDIKVGKIFLN